MKVQIDIETSTFIRFWLVVIGFIVGALILYKARVALVIIGSAIFFAIAMSPWVSRLAKILPSKSRVLGTSLAYLAIVSILALVVFLITPPLIDQSAKLAKAIPNLIDTASIQYEGISDFAKKYNLHIEFDKMILSIKDSATEVASSIGPQVIKSIGSVFGIIATIILVLVLAFLMLIEAPVWLDLIWRSYKDNARKDKHRKIIQKMYSIITSYVIGQLTVSAIAGAFSAILIFVLSLFFNIPANLVVPAAIIVFVSSLVPLFGSTIGAILISLVLILNSVTAMMIFLAIFIVYQQVEGNYIIPKIQSNKLDLSALSILIAITVGVYLMGIAGGIISVPIAGCIKVLIDDYYSSSKSKSSNKSLAS